MLSNKWFGKRRFLKVFTLVAMATRILHRTQLFEGIWKRTTLGTFLWNLVKIQSIVSEKFFEERVYRRTHRRTDAQTDGRNAMTIARWPSASGADNCVRENSLWPKGYGVGLLSRHSRFDSCLMSLYFCYTFVNAFVSLLGWLVGNMGV